MLIVLLLVLLDVIGEVPVSAKIDMTIPFWGACCAVVAGVIAIIKMNISIIMLKKDFDTLKNSLEKQAEDQKKELDSIKELIYELLTPSNRHHNGRHH
jgi:hypothetical protein